MSHNKNDNLDDTPNDDALDNTLHRALGKETAQFPAAAWLAKHRDVVAWASRPCVSRASSPRVAEVTACANQNNFHENIQPAPATGGTPVGHMGWKPMPLMGGTPMPRNTWRTIMHARVTKIAASIAAVAAAAILAVVWPAGNSPIALAATIEQLKTKSYELTLEWRDSYSNHETLPCAIMEPGKFRMERTDGEQTEIGIVDFHAKRVLILFEPHQAAFLLDDEKEFDDEMNPMGFLGQSIGDLWGLRTGQETKLDPQQIDGRDAQGFRLAKKRDKDTEMTITVWADAKTAAPLRVEITHTSSNGHMNYTNEIILRDFKVIENPDPARFSTQVPEGYAIVDRDGPPPPPPTPSKTQAIIDFLCQPLPVPPDATVLFLSRDTDTRWERPPLGADPRLAGGGNAKALKDGTLLWRKRIVLDVTDMTPEAVADILAVYKAHFEQFNFGFRSSGIRNGQGLEKRHDGRYQMASSALYGYNTAWTWNDNAWYRGHHCGLDIDVEVIDFVLDYETYKRHRVGSLYDTLQGQRVAWIRIDFLAQNLQGAGKWPEAEKTPDGAPDNPPAGAQGNAGETPAPRRAATPRLTAAMVLPQGNSVWFATFTPDGRQIVTRAGRDPLRVWDAADGKEVRTLQGSESVYGTPTFSPDGRRLVAGSYDHVTRIFDLDSGQMLTAIPGPEPSYVWTAAFSPDGQRVVTIKIGRAADKDRTVHVWDATTGKELAVMRGHENSVWDVAFSPDGKLVVTTSSDNTARLWDAATGEEVAVFKTPDNYRSWSAVFSPDGTRILATPGHGAARLWDVATGNELAVMPHNTSVESAEFSRDGTRIVTASHDWTVRLWNAADGKELAVMRGHTGGLRMAAFSPDGRFIVSASADKTARLWDATTGEALAVLTGHEGEVFSATFSPDGKRIITASADKTARVWDIGAIVEKQRGE